jgi:hypothetical protein
MYKKSPAGGNGMKRMIIGGNPGTGPNKAFKAGSGPAKNGLTRMKASDVDPRMKKFIGGGTARKRNEFMPGRGGGAGLMPSDGPRRRMGGFGDNVRTGPVKRRQPTGGFGDAVRTGPVKRRTVRRRMGPIRAL